MPNGKTVKNVLFLGLFTLGVFLVVKDISPSADFIGIFIMVIGAIRLV